MNKFLCASAFLLSASTGLCTTAAVAGQSEDEAAIRDVQREQADAWNRHDAAACARLFSEDGDVVNVLGWWWRGRAQIETKLGRAFAFMFRESRLSITDTSVRFLAPTTAVAHVRWNMTGARTPPGMPEPREGIEIQILQKTGAIGRSRAFKTPTESRKGRFRAGRRRPRPITDSRAPSAVLTL